VTELAAILSSLARRRGLLVLVALVVVVAAGGPAHARLPAPPFDLTISPSRVEVEGSTSIVISSVAGAPGDGERYDLYVLWAYAEEAAFLVPTGGWSPQPVAVALGVSPHGFAPRAVPWAGVRPVMDIPLALVVVQPGAHPLDRSRWIHRPVLSWVRVSRGDRPRQLGPEALLLGTIAVAGSLLIVLSGIRLGR
jgi:hypothetical protein